MEYKSTAITTELGHPVMDVYCCSFDVCDVSNAIQIYILLSHLLTVLKFVAETNQYQLKWV